MVPAGRSPRVGRTAPRLRSVWTEEHGLSALLALLLIYHLGMPLISSPWGGRLMSAAGLTLLSASGMLAVWKSRSLAVATRLVGAAAMVAAWAEVAYPRRETMFASSIGELTLFTFLLTAVAAQVFKSGPVSAHRIRGAIVIYLLIGVLFGILYVVLVLVQPGSIRFTSSLDLGNPQAIREELRYFSFVTLTTVGYGDVTPLSPIARSLATLEALSGQIYLAVTLARLVSNRVSERRDSRVRTAAQPRVRGRAVERDQETPT